MRRTYDEILKEHQKYYPGWLTYKSIQPDGKTLWKAKAFDEKEARTFKSLTNLERTLNRYHRYSEEYSTKDFEIKGV